MTLLLSCVSATVFAELTPQEHIDSCGQSLCNNDGVCDFNECIHSVLAPCAPLTPPDNFPVDNLLYRWEPQCSVDGIAPCRDCWEQNQAKTNYVRDWTELNGSTRRCGDGVCSYVAPPQIKYEEGSSRDPTLPQLYGENVLTCPEDCGTCTMDGVCSKDEVLLGSVNECSSLVGNDKLQAIDSVAPNDCSIRSSEEPMKSIYESNGVLTEGGDLVNPVSAFYGNPISDAYFLSVRDRETARIFYEKNYMFRDSPSLWQDRTKSLDFLIFKALGNSPDGQDIAGFINEVCFLNYGFSHSKVGQTLARKDIRFGSLDRDSEIKSDAVPIFYAVGPTKADPVGWICGATRIPLVAGRKYFLGLAEAARVATPVSASPPATGSGIEVLGWAYQSTKPEDPSHMSSPWPDKDQWRGRGDGLATTDVIGVPLIKFSFEPANQLSRPCKLRQRHGPGEVQCGGAYVHREVLFESGIDGKPVTISFNSMLRSTVQNSFSEQSLVFYAGLGPIYASGWIVDNLEFASLTSPETLQIYRGDTILRFQKESGGWRSKDPVDLTLREVTLDSDWLRYVNFTAWTDEFMPEKLGFVLTDSEAATESLFVPLDERLNTLDPASGRLTRYHMVKTRPIGASGDSAPYWNVRRSNGLANRYQILSDQYSSGGYPGGTVLRKQFIRPRRTIDQVKDFGSEVYIHYRSTVANDGRLEFVTNARGQTDAIEIHAIETEYAVRYFSYDKCTGAIVTISEEPKVEKLNFDYTNDSDGDGVYDYADTCPNMANSDQSDHSCRKLVWTFKYDSDGALRYIHGPDGVSLPNSAGHINPTAYSYSSNSITIQGRSQRVLTFNERDNSIEVAGPNFKSTHTYQSAFKNLTKIEDDVAGTTVFELDENGYVMKVTDPEFETVFSRDDQNRVKTVTLNGQVMTKTS